MGAIPRHVVQVKRKNSTSCNPPESKRTLVGSVASRLGPRDVAAAVTDDGVGCSVGGSCVSAGAVRVDDSEFACALGVRVGNAVGGAAVQATIKKQAAITEHSRERGAICRISQT